ncbi:MULTISPECIES: SipW-dependent-type signal peptide-containing protein [unclassified Micromonospora]|uniref:SipW-dependent-type signal peptide-containing protein n=1 Tax=unclassified Micromonospora TaxID=2617518 RepID=UPI0022B72E65|nr:MULTISPECIES: SipW-dependent-type signal peptide-containing protein [unclassified Micromonospora]MCZ7418630.1 SipW-dependent-type signal peptide-containing protein [Verrucosispora sp. WMMA2121]WBB92336.1 SipW-dependent-type signal peptide-containing protein [Verrucosispora sp. WMMC514]
MVNRRTSAGSPRFRRIRAVLAGALVLGLGATSTLAAWTDGEYGTGSFAASVFGTESQTASSSWTSHTPAANAAILAFSATAMSPSVSFYAYLDIRTTSTTNIGGTVTLTSSSNNSGALLPVLEYRAVRTPSTGTTCSAAAFTGTPTWIVGPSYLGVTSIPGPPVSSAITPPSGGTPQLRFCFEVRVQSGANNSYQGTTGAVTWEFTATST